MKVFMLKPTINFTDFFQYKLHIEDPLYELIIVRLDDKIRIHDLDDRPIIVNIPCKLKPGETLSFIVYPEYEKPMKEYLEEFFDEDDYVIKED